MRQDKHPYAEYRHVDELRESAIFLVAVGAISGAIVGSLVAGELAALSVLVAGLLAGAGVGWVARGATSTSDGDREDA
ncbi:protein of unknown function [Hyphomicrobium sp. MC1]|nr:protein of unknown function [Hyphomicrobium sp. MC1]